MAWRIEETDEGQDLVWDGVEFGIASSPTKGTANIQNANISTESGEVLASFGRTAQQQAAISNGTLTPDGATLFDAPASLKAGTWISVSASTVTSISTTTSPTTVSVITWWLVAVEVEVVKRLHQAQLEVVELANTLLPPPLCR